MTEGDFEADALVDVLRFLGSKQLSPVSVKPMEKTKLGIRGFFGGGINTSDKVCPHEYLALMLRVGYRPPFRDQYSYRMISISHQCAISLEVRRES